jgi:ribosomal protein S28E/S33
MPAAPRQMRYYRAVLGTNNRSRIIRDAGGPVQVGDKMDKIEKCVSDVVAIANGARKS